LISLPSIPQHLFIAAIGDERRVYEKSAWCESTSSAPADQASPIALELMDARKPIPEGASGVSPARIINQAQM